VDPVAAGLLVKKGDAFALAHPAPPEAVINHLSDHDWVLAEPAQAPVDAALERLVTAKAGHTLPEAQLLWMEHRIETRLSGVALYAALARGGDAAVAQALAKRGIPLLAAEDAAPEKR
jgi:hypothetical protein